MKLSLSINKSRLILFLGMLSYVLSIGLGAEKYLPYQLYAPGVFRSYSLGGYEVIGLIAVAALCTCFFPSTIDLPSDWFLAIFNVLLLAPGLTLGIASDDLDYSKKLIVLPALIAAIAVLSIAGKVGARGTHASNESARSGIFYFAILGWFVLFVLLVAKYHSVMRFSDAASIYEQRALTADVGGLWGYINLYFVYVFCTLLIAYGMSKGSLRCCLIGSAGYFLMYLITAEKSQLIFPIFFLAVFCLANYVVTPMKVFGVGLIIVAIVILGVVYLGQQAKVFDFAGFYLFSRLIATPGQFVLDYYEFFSTSGYTYFSQVRGFDLFVDVPSVYSSHPKWPQLGWVVGDGLHGIESNSNASFIASDGAASLGAIGMLLMACGLSAYLMVFNLLSKSVPKVFWSAIFAQQAFLLVSVSLFSLLLSFGGAFYFLFFVFWEFRRQRAHSRDCLSIEQANKEG